MPRSKKKESVEETTPLVIQEPHPRTIFVEKYKAQGYNVADVEGVLMFTGDYEIKDITKMLNADGYRGSYGVR